MSIFPKRMVAGSTVTIHWNIALPAGMEKAVCPYVRIGINTPDGHLHMLFEEHILILPSTAGPAPADLQSLNSYKYLNKQTPLLVLASYLSGSQPREKLVNILTNLQNGRHYYFTWSVPYDAPPGKYVLLSEMYIDGSLRYSGTVAEDFFYVERLNILPCSVWEVLIHNPGPEPVPAKIISYVAGQYQRPETLEVFQIAPGDSRAVSLVSQNMFLVYNEERITIPVHALQQPRALRNQRYLFLQKEKDGQQLSYVLPREGDNAWCLAGPQQQIWEAADGMNSAAMLREKDSAVYDEMLAKGLIIEIL